MKISTYSIFACILFMAAAGGLRIFTELNILGSLLMSCSMFVIGTLFLLAYDQSKNFTGFMIAVGMTLQLFSFFVLDWIPMLTLINERGELRVFPLAAIVIAVPLVMLPLRKFLQQRNKLLYLY
jgi:hypothetical protein